MLHVTSVHKFLHEIVQLKDANHLQIPMRPFGGSTNVVHVYNNGRVINCKGEFASEFKETPPNIDNGCVDD